MLGKVILTFKLLNYLVVSELYYDLKFMKKMILLIVGMYELIDF